MSWSYLLVVLTVVLVPGIDVLMVLRNTVGGGRSAGIATTVGIGTASAIQGALVSLGVGTLIVRSQPLFTAVKWAGVAYLVYLGLQSLRSAWRGHGPLSQADRAGRGFRQGFVCNITNPKMLVFYLSLLPQFVDPAAPVWAWLAHAWVLPVVGCLWLLLVAALASTVRDRLLRPLARRVTDAVSGVAFVGFGLKLATDN
jgi:threonine/homoserine/homoserine lactone efflux protein